MVRNPRHSIKYLKNQVITNSSQSIHKRTFVPCVTIPLAGSWTVLSTFVYSLKLIDSTSYVSDYIDQVKVLGRTRNDQFFSSTSISSTANIGWLNGVQNEIA